MAATDVILAAGPSVVAVAAIGSALWQHRRRIDHERTLHDVDELRGLLDEAAETIRSVRDTVARPEGTGWLDAGIADLERLESRLIIRLGPDDPVTTAEIRCLDALRSIRKLYEVDAPEIGTDAEEEEFWDRFEALRDQYAQRATQYFDACREIVGSRLVVRESPPSRWRALVSRTRVEGRRRSF